MKPARYQPLVTGHLKKNGSGVISKPNKVQIRSNTAEFLVFTTQAGEKGIEVRVEDETVWLTQKLIGVLFDVDVRTVSEHLQNIFNSGELTESAVIRKFRNTASDGKSYLTAFYNLDAIIAVVSSPSIRLQGRGRSPSGPKIQAQRAVKPKSKISPARYQLPVTSSRRSREARRRTATAATPLIQNQYSASMLPDNRHFDFCVVKC